jgi:hypothetical protein
MAGGIITTGSHPKALWPGVKLWWGNEYNKYPEQWKLLVNSIMESDKSYEDIVQDTPFGLAPVKGQGSGVYMEANVQGYTGRATHVTYALGYAVTMEELQDNLYEQVSRSRASANAFSQRTTREIVVANVMNNGFDSNFPIADGAAFFSTSHPFTSGGTFSNKPTVDADLSETTLEDGLIAIRGFTDDAGKPINVMPEMLVVARQNEYNASRIMDSLYQNDTANNAVNAIRATGALPKGFTVNVYLTDTNAWFIKNAIPAGSGFTFFERIPLTFDQDNDFSTKNALASSITRFSVVVNDPRCYYGSAGTS